MKRLSRPDSSKAAKPRILCLQDLLPLANLPHLTWPEWHECGKASVPKNALDYRICATSVI